MKSCTYICRKLVNMKGALYRSEYRIAAAIVFVVIVITTALWRCISLLQRHYVVAITITINTMVAAIWYSLHYSVPLKLSSSTAVSTTFHMMLSMCYLCMSRTRLSACFGCCDLQNTDKHTVKNWNEYAPVFCEAVFGTVLVPGTGVQPYKWLKMFTSS